MRIAPLAMIVLFVLLVGSTVGTTFLWVIAGISVLALIALIVIMYKAQSFVGPRVIVDDLRDKLDSYGREEPEPDVVVVEAAPDKEAK